MPGGQGTQPAQPVKSTAPSRVPSVAISRLWFAPSTAWTTSAAARLFLCEPFLCGMLRLMAYAPIARAHWLVLGALLLSSGCDQSGSPGTTTTRPAQTSAASEWHEF